MMYPRIKNSDRFFLISLFAIGHGIFLKLCDSPICSTIVMRRDFGNWTPTNNVCDSPILYRVSLSLALRELRFKLVPRPQSYCSDKKLTKFSLADFYRPTASNIRERRQSRQKQHKEHHYLLNEFD